MPVARINAISTKFKPEQHDNEYRDAREKVVRDKLKGEKLVASAISKPRVDDMMAALRANIEAAKNKPTSW